MNNDDLCPMSDLPPDQCALPCHGNVDLPSGVASEIRRGVEPSGWSTSLTVPAAEQHEPRDTRRRTSRPKGKPVDCRHDAVSGDWLTREHTRDCRAHACEGCKPCPEDHCAMRGNCPNHVNHDVDLNTCPSCIGEVRGLIIDIETLTALVHVELEHASVDSEVAVLAGPVADPDQLDARRAVVTRIEDARGWCDYPRPWLHTQLFELDVNHPVTVFARWERDLRLEYEQPRPPTEFTVWPMPHGAERDLLSRSADYFRGMLAGRFPHDEPFEAFARDMRRLRNHLETVLSDSRAPETGAPCPTCAELLEGTDRKAPRLVLRRSHWCDDEKCESEHDRTGSDDRWVCPDDDAHWWSAADYRLRVAAEYLEHAEELTADQIRRQYGIPAGTVRRWASTTRRFVGGAWVEQPAQLRAAGRTPSGVRLYRVAEVLALRQQREKAEA